ncbi:MAG: PQQ-binding-like beta-propeller repeat protein, partial [Planctomycetota bacterium]
DHESCKLLDPATGQVRDEIVAPKKLTGGTFWKWMALDDGVLYALVGKDEQLDRVAKWRRRHHGWPWNGISDGYNKGPYRWGFAATLLAIDPETKKVLWHHKEEVPLDSRGIAMAGGRIFACSFGQEAPRRSARYILCLDTKTGREIWRRTAEKHPDVLKAVGPYRPGHGYIGGWKSTVFARATERALYLVGLQVNWLSAFAAEDGRFLWKFPAKDLHVVVRDDGLYTIGPQKSQGLTRKLDPWTGEVQANFPVSRRACTRSVGTADGILFRAHGGSVRLDLASGKPQWISPMRPSCHIGVVVAHGHLYWVPWVCDCNLQMFGAIACGPAGDFDFDQPADGKRLEPNNYTPDHPALGASPNDWPAYRGNSARTATTQAALPGKVGRLWSAQCGQQATQPVAAGGRVFVADGCGVVRCLDAATGKPGWTAFTGGQVRYPPTIAQDCVYVGSADGHAYCFEAVTGTRLWRFRAAPDERRIPVYGRLVSTWPVASGVLVADGVAYLACGMNNFDGTHVYALDARTGRIRWQNNTCGHLDAFSRRGVACQGDLLLHDGRLYLAGGNATSPGVFDVRTGECLSKPPTWTGSRAPRGRELRLADRKITVSGQPLYSDPAHPVFSRECAWKPWQVTAKSAVLSCQRREGAWHLVAHTPGGKQELWARALEAEPVRWGIAVDAPGRIFVTLRNGQVLCFGAKG